VAQLTAAPAVAVTRWQELASGPAAAHSGFVPKKRWRDLDPRARQTILLAGAFESGLKIAALIDLAQRPRRDIRGSKAGWAGALALVNSGGVVPIVYLLRGRRTG
jgi:hypothetical protein